MTEKDLLLKNIFYICVIKKNFYYQSFLQMLLTITYLRKPRQLGYITLSLYMFCYEIKVFANIDVQKIH
jgi:hypothetical protein